MRSASIPQQQDVGSAQGIVRMLCKVTTDAERFPWSGGACLLEVVGVLARQKGVGAAGDEVVEGHEDVFKVVDGPFVEALNQLRPQRPHALRYLPSHTQTAATMAVISAII